MFLILGQFDYQKGKQRAMKKLLMASFCLFLTWPSVMTSQMKSSKPIKPDGNKALEHIKFLAAEEMKGRKSGTPEYQKAAEYVAAQMKEVGLHDRPLYGGELARRQPEFRRNLILLEQSILAKERGFA